MPTVACCRFFLRIGIFLIAFLSLHVRSTSAQQPLDDFSQNLPPFGSFSGSDFDIVSLQNGNLHISIPIINVPQRGGTTFSYKFMYDTPFWDYSYVVLSGKGSFKILADASSLGWHFVTPSSWSVQPFQTKVTCVNGNDTSINYRVIDPEGVKHPFYLNNSGGICSVPTTRGPAFDGSGLVLDVGTGGKGLILKDGSYPGEDNNGNIFDTLNRNLMTATEGPSIAFTTPLGQTTQNHAQYELDSYQDSNGTTQNYRIDYTGVDVHTGLCGNAPPNFCNDTIIKTAVLPSRLTLPNGTYYQFTWVNDSQEQIQRIDLPTGAYITYTYATADDCDLQSDGLSKICRIPIISRTVVQGGVSSIWNYNAGTVTDPYGNKEVHAFTNLQVGNAVSAGTVETQVSYYSGSSVLLKKVVNTYTGEANPFTNSDVMNIRLIRQDTTLNNGQTRSFQTDYETFTATACQLSSCVATTATRMNPTATREYEYGANAPGALLRTTNYSYLHTNNQTYINANIVDRVTTKTILNGLGTQVAQTQFEFDNYSHLGQPMLASGAVQHDPTYSTSYVVRGNVTAGKAWRNTDGSLLTTTNQYDDAGSLLSSIDPLGNKTSFDYTDSWTNATCAPSGGQGKAYLTTITNALNQKTTKTFDSCTGRVASSTDLNLKTTRFSYDLMGRLSTTSFPDGGQISNVYNDSQTPQNVVTTTKITSNLNKISTTVFDSLGRVQQTQLNSDSEGVTFVDTSYDLLGRKSSESNPHRTATLPTDGTTSYFYDAISRPCLVVPPDGTQPTGSSCPTANPGGDLLTTFSGNTTTVVDQAGKARKSAVDALGRLTTVWEDPSGLDYETDYAYDALGNLTNVSQSASRPRTFSYNSLSQLTKAQNPESGQIFYTYDNAGNLQTKVAPLPNQTGPSTVTTTYSYDLINRLTGKTYTNGDAAISYTYDQLACLGLSACDNIGHRTGMTDAAGSEAWSYSIPLRTTVDRRIDGTLTKTVTSVSNLDGSQASMTYPSGRIVTYTPGGAGRALSVADTTTNYATAALYAPPGSLSSIANGASLISTFYYNKRLQPCRISAKSSGTAPTTCTDTASVGNVLDFSYSFSVGAGDNGNISAIVNNRFPNRSQNFTYDTLNRILTATTAATHATDPTDCWGEAYVYDSPAGPHAWGNLVQINSASSAYTGCTQEGFNQSITANNQILGWCYDAAGNLLAEAACGAATYVYNAENQMTSTAGVTYKYDGDGKRVSKSSSKVYWYGGGGDPITETDALGNVLDEYVFFGGKRIARRDSAGNVDYYIADHLGTSRIVASSAGTILDQSDFYPFGGERIISASSGNTYKFTGKERDSESGLDNFNARYDESSIGRFMSADPITATPLHVVNPQRWNMYAYVVNNPIAYVDPDGKDAIAVNVVGEVPIGGHEGIIVVHSDGSATYARFGPLHGNSPTDSGKITIQALNPVRFGADGLPTDASYKELAGEVAKVEGDPNLAIQVGFNYFKTPEADSILLDNWIQAWKTATAPNYQVNGQNCAAFCISGLLVAHAIQNHGISLIPNRLFLLLSPQADENWTWEGKQPNSEPHAKRHTKVGCLKHRDGSCAD